MATPKSGVWLFEVAMEIVRRGRFILLVGPRPSQVHDLVTAWDHGLGSRAHLETKSIKIWCEFIATSAAFVIGSRRWLLPTLRDRYNLNDFRTRPCGVANSE
jgi:hypothetical protein